MMNRMKAAPVLIFCALLQSLIVDAQDINRMIISIELKNATLEEALTRLEKLTPLKFNYKTADIAGVTGIWYQQYQVPVKKVLNDLLSKASLQYEQVQNHILIKKIRALAPQPVKVYGFVTSVHSGETLTGATVSIAGDKTWSAITNAYGFYSVTVPAGNYSFNCSHIGFRDLDQQISIRETFRNNIELVVKENDTMQPVIVTTAAKKNNIRKVATGNHRLDIADIKKMAMAGGEPDILKSLQFLPGIQTSNEGTTNLSVRGGSYDQNLILLDEAPVYNPTHTLGFFSAFNTDALKDVSIYKGVFPSQYGGRLSSVVDIRMKEGNSKQQAVYGGIGVLASRLTYEGPIKKERSSFLLSGRYSNIGVLMNMYFISNLIKFRTRDSKVAFADLNAKFNTILGKKDRLYLSAYTGHDNFYLDLIDNANKMNWGNTTVTARWNHVFNAGLFANTALLYSHYNYSYAKLDDTRDFTWKANLKEVTLKTDFDWTINTNNLIKFGAGITSQDILPGRVLPQAPDAPSKEVSLNNRRSFQLFAYINNEQKISKQISISYGLRATGFAVAGDAWVYKYNADTTEAIDSTWYPKGKIIRSYFGAEPKVMARILLSNSASLKFAYGRNYQFQHLLTNSSVGLPTDLWLPSDTYLKPQYADHFSVGLYKTFFNELFEGSVELYYRKSYNVIDFKDNAEIFLNDKIETQLLTGQGKGYGLELLIKKNKGLSNGWISYTWSKALRRINGINNNEWYPPAYDHRHNFSLVYNQKITKRWSLSANWIYRSGGRTTIPIGSYVINGVRFLYYGKRNGYRLPANHRLDLSVVWQEKLRQKRKWQGEWVFSIYNVYNRENVFALYIGHEPNNYTKVKATKVYLVGILPTVTYNFKF